MSAITHFIYDLDGTLDDSMPSHTQAFLHVLSTCGAADRELPRLGEQYNASAGMPLRQQFAQALSSQGIRADLDDCVAKLWESHEHNNPNPFPGAVSLITAVFRRQGKQYITTGSRTTRATSRVEQMGLRPYFSLILGQGDGIDKGRQHLQLFKEHSKDADFEKQAIYLGDGPKDMEYARDFGIMAVGISTTLPEQKLRDAGAQHVIASLEQFLPLVEKIENQKD